MKISWNEPTQTTQGQNGIKSTTNIKHVNEDASINNVIDVLNSYNDYEIDVNIKIK